ncbi:CYTH domain-containing protein [Enterococcus faecalis]
MSEHLEIEFKTLVVQKDFERLTQFFALTEDHFFYQKNYYYDSSDFLLKKQNMGLRIRTFSNHAEVTLKIPAPEGLLEINDSLSLDAAQRWLDTDTAPTSGPVYEKLIQIEVDPNRLHVFGSLTTRRAEITIPSGILALDENWYNHHHDYELELEVTDAVTGKAAFDMLMERLTIPVIPAPNKIQRMFQTLA